MLIVITFAIVAGIVVGAYMAFVALPEQRAQARLRSRLTLNDQQAQERVEAFLKPGEDIHVTRLISTRTY